MLPVSAAPYATNGGSPGSHGGRGTEAAMFLANLAASGLPSSSPASAASSSLAAPLPSRQVAGQHRPGGSGARKRSSLEAGLSGGERNPEDGAAGSKASLVSRRERKNNREKQRRLEVNVMFDRLMDLLELPKDSKSDKVKVASRTHTHTNLPPRRPL